MRADAENKRKEEELKREREESLKRREAEARRLREAAAAEAASLARIEEERKSREREALRLKEEERRRREEAEAKRLEEQRKRKLEEARRAEEASKKRAEEARRKAELDKERRKKEELERMAREKALADRLQKERAAAKAAMRREVAYSSLKRACADESASSFVRKVRAFVPDELSDAVCPAFRPMLAAATKQEIHAAAVELARRIQPIVAKMAEYAALYQVDAESELNDPATVSEQRRRQLREVPAKMKLFLENAARIAGKDVEDSDVHMACATIIEMIPLWF